MRLTTYRVTYAGVSHYYVMLGDRCVFSFGDDGRLFTRTTALRRDDFPDADWVEAYDG